MTKIYVTKYALTLGINVMEAEINSRGYAFSGGGFNRYCLGPNDYWLTPEDAITRATEMRERKILSLEKQLSKLRSMTFEVVE